MKRRNVQTSDRPENSPHLARRGFALMDVILGGVLLSIGLAAVISLASRALKSQTDGEKEMSASWLCDELLALVVVDGPSNYSRLHDTNGQFDYPFTDFSYDLDIQSQGNDLPYVVTATVSWQGGGGPRNVQVQTIIADRKDDPNELRAPEEPIDRDQRWYGDQEENGAGTGAGGTGAPGGTGGTGGGSGGGSSTGGGTANAPR